MIPEEFIARWTGNVLTERAGAQAHFDDLFDCQRIELTLPLPAIPMSPASFI